MNCTEKEKLEKLTKEVHGLGNKISNREGRDKTLAWAVGLIVTCLGVVLLLFYNSIDNVRNSIEEIRLNGVSTDIYTEIRDIKTDIGLLKADKLDEREFERFQTTFKQEQKENIETAVKIAINDELKDFEEKILNIIIANQEKQNTEYHGIISTLGKINKKLDEK